VVTTNFAKSRIALLIGNSGVATGLADSVPGYFVIGSGSGTALVTQTILINTFDRQLMTSTDVTTVQKVTFQGDWNSIELSGTNITEFGLIQSGGGITGSIWSRTGFPGITFDGTNELQIQETMEVF
jgi:hypothetical protein